jgi:lipopolysaccharide transport system permease protein
LDADGRISKIIAKELIMREMINELIQYRHLLYMITLRDIKVRYKQSVMGFMWAIFMPMMIVAAGIIIKLAISFVAGKPFVLADIASVSVKALPWSFFVSSIKFATNSLVGNRNLVTKIYFPREVFPLASVLSSLFDFTLASVVLILILMTAQIGVSIYILWIPFLLILLIFLIVGLAMFLSCANLFYRDVKYIVDVILTFAIFFTPVFYEASIFGKWAPLILINPMSTILEAINSVVILHRAPDIFWMTYATFWSFGGLLLGWTIFHRAEFVFAERI